MCTSTACSVPQEAPRLVLRQGSLAESGDHQFDWLSRPASLRDTSILCSPSTWVTACASVYRILSVGSEGQTQVLVCAAAPCQLHFKVDGRSCAHWRIGGLVVRELTRHFGTGVEAFPQEGIHARYRMPDQKVVDGGHGS